MKTCRRCWQSKDEEEFHRNSRAKDGRRNECKLCAKEHHRQWYQDNLESQREKIATRVRHWRENHPEKAREVHRKWLGANPGYVAESSRRWRETHPEEKAADGRRYYLAHREEVLERTRQYRMRNPDVQRAKWTRRRAWKAENGGDFTADEWQALCAEFGNVCICCGAPEVTVDHVVPLSAGGANAIDNIQPLCKSCNSRKSAKAIDYRMKYAVEHWYSHF